MIPPILKRTISIFISYWPRHPETLFYQSSLESVFQLLIEMSLDFLDLKLKKHFYPVHKRIFQVIEQKRPEEAKRLIKEDIKDVMEQLKGFKSH